MRFLLAGLALLLGVLPARATPSIVEISAWATGAASSCAISGFTVAAGNNIIVIVAQDGGDATVSYTVADSTNGAYTEATTARSENISQELNTHYFLNSAAATVTITVTQVTSAVNFSCVAIEVATSAGTTLAFDVGGSAAHTTVTAWVGEEAGVATAAEVIGFAAGSASATMGTKTPGAGWTTLGAAGVLGANHVQYRASAAALTGETGPWTISNARSGPGSLAFFKQVGTSTCINDGLLLLGVGRACD
jgi:hypothetical protein